MSGLLRNKESQVRAEASGFVPRKFCPKGHDLSVHGYDWNNSIRCKLCNVSKATKQNNFSVKKKTLNKGCNIFGRTGKDQCL